MSEPIPIEWTGDLDDDCYTTVGELSAHCEAMDDEVWHVAVYRNDREHNRPEHYLFHSSYPAGVITHGDMARAVCESIIRAYYATPTTPLSKEPR